MNRLERLLDLALVLLRAREPVTFAALREDFSDYRGDNPESARRKFERDKAALLELGLSVRYVDDELDENEPGYVIDAEASFLPETSLSEQERALLVAAARGAIDSGTAPYADSLRLALAKIGAEGSSSDRLVIRGAPATREELDLLERLTTAIADRKRVVLRYTKPDGTSSERVVAGYGVFRHERAWYLVGLDHSRSERRTFRLSRIESVSVDPKGGKGTHYEVPEDFDLDAAARIDPLAFELHPPVICKVRVEPEVAFLVERRWGKADDRGEIVFETTNVDRVVEEVLSLGARAELLEPPEARVAIASELRSIIEAHEGA
jgi:predicted DNA-binding transcriptional regulator YafY